MTEPPMRPADYAAAVLLVGSAVMFFVGIPTYALVAFT